MFMPDDLEPRRVGRLWIFPDGTTLPVVSGGDGDEDDTEVDDADADEVDDVDADEVDDKPLGPKGEKALAAEKERRRQLATQLREWKALGLSPAEVKAKLEAEGGKDGGDGPDLERLKAEARAEAQAEATRERLLDKIEAKAARLFADPDDAAALLMRRHEVDDFLDDDGKVDAEAIVEALDELIKAKPYLAVKASATDDDDGDGDEPPKSKPPKVPTGPRGGKVKPLADHSVDDFRELLKRER